MSSLVTKGMRASEKDAFSEVLGHWTSENRM
jgi:hypothetical protein